MVFRTTYPWYIKPPAYGISFDPPTHCILFDPPNPWYIEPPTYGILFDLPYPWYIEPIKQPVYGILSQKVIKMIILQK